MRGLIPFELQWKGIKIFTKINGLYGEENTYIYRVNRKKSGVDSGADGTSKSFELLQV
jgi:hypothetical protein